MLITIFRASNANTATTVASAELAAWATQTGETRSARTSRDVIQQIGANNDDSAAEQTRLKDYC